jgi:hypothetical protein
MENAIKMFNRLKNVFTVIGAITTILILIQLILVLITQPLFWTVAIFFGGYTIMKKFKGGRE